MRWQFVKAAPDRYFVTSDNPVVFDRVLGLKAATLIFPLSQKLVLIADHASEDDLAYREAIEEETLKLNTMTIITADQEVYSPYPDRWIHLGWTEGFRFEA